MLQFEEKKTVLLNGASNYETSQLERPSPIYLLPDKAAEAYQPMGHFN